MLCHLQSPGDGICVTGRVTHVGSVIRLSPGPGRGRPGRRRRHGSGDDYRRDRPGLGPVSRTRAGPSNRAVTIIMMVRFTVTVTVP